MLISWISSTGMQKWTMKDKQKCSSNLSVIVTTPKVAGTGQNVTFTHHAVLTQKIWVLNEQWLAFEQVLQLGINREKLTWLLNTYPGGYDICMSDHNQHSGVAQMSVLHGWFSQPNIITSIIYRIPLSREDHMTWPKETGDMLRSDKIGSYIVMKLHQCTPL